MHRYLLVAAAVLLLHCQKEVSTSAANTAGTVKDSVSGRWNYLYDYRLVAGKSSPGIIIDSVYSGNYTPYSYFELKADSTYKWYRTTSTTLPTAGYGQGGTWWVDANRNIWLRMQYTTTNDFLTTSSVTPSAAAYKIKQLGAGNMLLYFRVSGADPAQYWYWHDVFSR